MAEPAFLRIQNLSIVAQDGATLVEDISFDVPAGQSLGILGESGSGKTLTALAVLRLLPPSVKQTKGEIYLDGKPLSDISEAEMCQIRGGQVGFVFQEPAAAFNPVLRVGTQVGEAMEIHQSMSKSERDQAVLGLMEECGLQNPREVARSYPHQLSGGMLQRAMIAAALSGNPKLLIADEPTTALDVTVQAEILELVNRLRQNRGLALMWISHDLGVLAAICKNLIVMKDGGIVEEGSVEKILNSPNDRYTQTLVAAAPRLEVEF
ncbi:MAG: ABC transporter ATP-binding protein [Planctomycetota bacterium]|nr:ABC transporter ATP-binding protein [Planctomycetota bacterium]MDP6942184.1 ABC transporter ATP-binding protein [Planctomycetota bacterium]